MKWRCAVDFFRVKLKMAATEQIQFFCGRKNSNLKSEIIQILLSHTPLYGDVQVIFQGFTEIQNGRHG